MKKINLSQVVIRHVSRFLKHFTHKYLLLEARDRIGGRIHTVRCGDVDGVLELGAQWIHGGCPANSLYNFALARDLLGAGRRPRKEGATDDSHHSLGMLSLPRGHYLSSDGRILGETAVRQAWSVYVGVAEQMLYFTGPANSSSSATSLVAGDGTMDDFFWSRADRLVRDSRQTGQWSEDAELALSAMAQSLASYVSDELNESGPYMSEELPGGDIIVPEGLAQLTASLAADLPPGAVRLQETVTRIAWDDAGVSVTTTRASADGANSSNRCYRAAHAVVTLPLGVLAAGSPDLFSPSLDAAKQRAVRNMRTGRLAKVFLKWERPWWTVGEGSLYFAWSRSEVAGEEAALPAHWVRHISALSEVEGQPHLLLMWVFGAAAAVVDSLEDEEILADVGRLLRQFTGDPGLELPVR